MFASSLSSFFEMKGGFCIDVLHYNGIVVPPQPTYIPACIPEISENDFFLADSKSSAQNNSKCVFEASKFCNSDFFQYLSTLS